MVQHESVSLLPSQTGPPAIRRPKKRPKNRPPLENHKTLSSEANTTPSTTTTTPQRRKVQTVESLPKPEVRRRKKESPARVVVGKSLSSPLSNKEPSPARDESVSDQGEEKKFADIIKKSARKLHIQKKLLLIVDIDQTLVDATKDLGAEKLVNEPAFKDEVFKITFDNVGGDEPYFVKLRPHVAEFLRVLKNHYHLAIYTMGIKAYANKILSIIDPDGTIFKNRVMSRENYEDNVKEIQRLFHCDESMVIIVDDRVDVWSNSTNVLKIHKFHFWPVRDEDGTTDYLSSEVMKSTGIREDWSREYLSVRDNDNVLKTTANVLQACHRVYYLQSSPEKLAIEDTRTIFRDLKKTVLRGVVALFSGVFPMNQDPTKAPQWILAEEFGAVCTHTFTDQVTHVVSARIGTAKVHRARKMGIFVCNIGWLYSCSIHFQRMPEEFFPCSNQPNPVSSFALQPVNPIKLSERVLQLRREIAASDGSPPLPKIKLPRDFVSAVGSKQNISFSRSSQPNQLLPQSSGNIPVSVKVTHKGEVLGSQQRQNHQTQVTVRQTPPAAPPRKNQEPPRANHLKPLTMTQPPISQSLGNQLRPARATNTHAEREQLCEIQNVEPKRKATEEGTLRLQPTHVQSTNVHHTKLLRADRVHQQQNSSASPAEPLQGHITPHAPHPELSRTKPSHLIASQRTHLQQSPSLANLSLSNNRVGAIISSTKVIESLPPTHRRTSLKARLDKVAPRRAPKRRRRATMSNIVVSPATRQRQTPPPQCVALSTGPKPIIVNQTQSVTKGNPPAKRRRALRRPKQQHVIIEPSQVIDLKVQAVTRTHSSGTQSRDMEVDVDKSPSITPPVRAPPPQLRFNATNNQIFANVNRTLSKISLKEKAEMTKIADEVKKSLIEYTAANGGWVASEVIYVHIRKKFPIKTLEKIGFVTSKKYFDSIGVFLTAQHGDRLLVRYNKEMAPVEPEVYPREERKPKNISERVISLVEPSHSGDQPNVHLDSFGRIVPRIKPSNSRSPTYRKYRQRGANYPKENDERGDRRRRLHERSRERSERRDERRSGYTRRVVRDVRRERSRERTRYRESSLVNGREAETVSDHSKRRLHPSSLTHSPKKDVAKELTVPSSSRKIGDSAAVLAKRAVTPQRSDKGKHPLSRRDISKLVDPSEPKDNTQESQKRSRLQRKHSEEKSGSRERSLTPMKVTITKTEENSVKKSMGDAGQKKGGSMKDLGSDKKVTDKKSVADVKNLKPLTAPLFYGPAGNMRPMQSLDPSMSHSYQKCRYYMKGLCRKEDCLFLHDKIQLFIAPKHGRWKPKPRELYLGPAQSSEAEDQKAVEKLQKQSAYLGAIGHINSFPKVRTEKVAKVLTEEVILSEPSSVPDVDLLATPSLPFKHYLHGPKTMIGRWTPRGAGTEKSRTPVYSEEEDLDKDDPFADILSQHMTISNENPEGTSESGRVNEKSYSKDSSKKRRKSKEKRSKKKRDGKQARKANHRKKKHRKKKVESEEEEGEISEEECPGGQQIYGTGLPGGVSKRELPSLFIGTDRPAPAAQRG